MVCRAKIEFEHELTTIKVKFDQSFELKFYKLDNRLATLCKIQNLKIEANNTSEAIKKKADTSVDAEKGE